MIREDVLQPQQLVSCCYFAEFGPGGDPVGSPGETDFAKIRQGTRGSRRQPVAKFGAHVDQECGLDHAHPQQVLTGLAHIPEPF
jgi:hypothetical protein